MQLRITACALALVFSACASSGAAHSSSGGSRYLITADEIAQSQQSDAFAVVQSLRPNMLSQKGPNAVSGDDPGIVVFVNGQRQGDVNTLRQIHAGNVLQIQFLTPGEAQYKYGTGYPEGIIDVKMKSN